MTTATTIRAAMAAAHLHRRCRGATARAAGGGGDGVRRLGREGGCAAGRSVGFEAGRAGGRLKGQPQAGTAEPRVPRVAELRTHPARSAELPYVAALARHEGIWLSQRSLPWVQNGHQSESWGCRDGAAAVGFVPAKGVRATLAPGGSAPTQGRIIGARVDGRGGLTISTGSSAPGPQKARAFFPVPRTGSPRSGRERVSRSGSERRFPVRVRRSHGRALPSGGPSVGISTS